MSFTPETLAIGVLASPTGASVTLVATPTDSTNGLFTVSLPTTVAQIVRPTALPAFSGYTAQQLNQTASTEAAVPQTTPPTEPGAYQLETALTTTLAFLTPTNKAGAQMLAGGYSAVVNATATVLTVTFYGGSGTFVSPSFAFQVVRVSSLLNSGS